MIFQQIAAIQAGRKTMTQRVEQEGETAIPALIPDYDTGERAIEAVKDKNGRLKWRVGCVYATVPKRGQHGVGFIRIVSIERVSVQDMTEQDALDEGVGSLAEYRELWGRINKKKGRRWIDNPTVWRIRFEVA